MSVFPTNEPECTKAREATVETVIEAKPRKIDGFEVGRALPAIARRHLGPFVFFDHMGPAELEPGHGMDVRPHPHIGLSTVTYLFEGEIVHKDSLGVVQSIRPGAVNWMTAGRGIVHSERTSAELRKSGSPLHGLQLWVALMKEHEETEPAFQHCAAADLPELSVGGAVVRVLAGSAFGATSPVKTLSPLFYVEAKLRAGDRISLPTDHEERGVYVVEGALGCGPDRIEKRRLVVFQPGADVTLTAASAARIVMLGGAPPDGPRHIWWNFVSSSKERIEQAKLEWQALFSDSRPDGRELRFAEVAGETEWIPLPER